MQTSLSVPNFCGKVIEAIVSPQMGSKNNLQLVAQRFSHIYQSCLNVPSTKTIPPKTWPKNPRKSQKRETGLFDRPICVVETHESDPTHVKKLAETRFSEIPPLHKRSTWIFPIFSSFSRRKRISTRLNNWNDEIILCTPSYNSSICLQNSFVPFLWPKGWISAFSSIWQSIVSAGRVVYRHELHSGYFYSKEYVTIPERYHRPLTLPAETKTLRERFSVVRKITAQSGSSNCRITFSDSQKISSDSNNYP